MDILKPTVEAYTISVVQHPTDSVRCFLQLNEESINLTLRLENDTARLAGFPQSWKVWDEEIEYGEEKQYHEIDDSELLDLLHEEAAYVSQSTERKIFEQLKTSLKKQFEDPDFSDKLSKEEKESIFLKIDNAIKALN